MTTVAGAVLLRSESKGSGFHAISSDAIVIPTLIDLKHLIAVSGRWPRWPLVCNDVVSNCFGSCCCPCGTFINLN